MKSMVTGCFLFLFCGAKAQDTMHLQDIIMHINMHSQHLKMYDAQMRSEQAAAEGAYSWMPPEAGTGLWMAPYNPKLWQKTKDGMQTTQGMGQYMISAQQMFPNRKRQNAEASYLGAIPSVTNEKKEVMQNDLYAEAKKNYYEWIVIKKKMNVLNENEKLIDFMIKSAEIRYKNGVGKIDAYYKAKAALGNIHNTKLMLQNDMNQKRIALNTLMHRNRMVQFDIDTTIKLKDYTAIAIDSLSLVNSRSDIQALEKEKEVTGLQRDFEKTKLKPEFGVRYDHMFGFGGTPMQYSLMAMVKIPFAKWSSKGVNANMESLKWKAVQQDQERMALINEALGMAYSIKTEIETKSKQIKVYEEEIIPAYRRNYQTMQLGYEQNTEELFMLYDAWEKLNMAQQEYLEQLQQLLVMGAELERILEIKEP